MCIVFAGGLPSTERQFYYYYYHYYCLLQCYSKLYDTTVDLVTDLCTACVVYVLIMCSFLNCFYTYLLVLLFAVQLLPTIRFGCDQFGPHKVLNNTVFYFEFRGLITEMGVNFLRHVCCTEARAPVNLITTQ